MASTTLVDPVTDQYKKNAGDCEVLGGNKSTNKWALRANIWLCVACSLIVIAASVSVSFASNFKLNDFTEVDKDQIATLLPGLARSYHASKFLTSGFTTPSGKWTIVRIEGNDTCDDAFCLTVIVHDQTEWRLMIKAARDINVSMNHQAGEVVEWQFRGEAGAIVVRYMDREKVLYVVQ